MKSIFNNKKLVSLIIMSIVIAGGLVCIFSYSVGVNAYDKYDFLEDLLWTKATIDSGKFISPDFCYFYTVPFGANIIMAPFVYFLGPCLLANQLGILVYYIVYLVVIFRLAKFLFEETSSRYIFVAIATVFVFTYIGDNLLHHILYYGIAYVCFLGELGCCIAINDKKNKVLNYLLLLFFVLWSSSNGIACFGISTAALVFGLIVQYILKNRTVNIIKNKDITFLLSYIIISSIVGLAINKIVNLGANTLGLENARMVLTSIDNVVNNFVIKLARCFLEIFVANNDNPIFFSFGFFSSMFSYFFALVFIIFSIYSVKKIYRKKDDKVVFIELCSYFVIAVCLFMFIFSNENSERYLFNGMLSIFIFDAISFEELFKGSNFLCNILIVSALLIQEAASFLLIDRIYEEKEKNIVRAIEDNNLKHGYVTEYHGAPLFTFSKGELKLAYYHMDHDFGDKIVINYANNFIKNYEKPHNADEFFILFNDINYETFSHYDVFSKCKQVIRCDDLYIVVFDVEYWNQV